MPEPSIAERSFCDTQFPEFALPELPEATVLDTDMLVVDLFALQGSATLCRDCLEASDLCVLVQRSYRCGDRRNTVQAARDSLRGLEMRGLDPTVRYCMRVLAVDRSDATGPDEGAGGLLTSCDADSVQRFESREGDAGPDSGASVADVALPFCALSTPIQLSVAGGAVSLQDFGCGRAAAAQDRCEPRREERYTHEGTGRLIRREASGAADRVPDVDEWTWEADRVVGWVSVEGEQGDRRERAFTYDERGRLTSWSSHDGHVGGDITYEGACDTDPVSALWARPPDPLRSIGARACIPSHVGPVCYPSAASTAGLH